MYVCVYVCICNMYVCMYVLMSAVQDLPRWEGGRQICHVAAAGKCAWNEDVVRIGLH